MLLLLGGLYFVVLELREPFYFLWDDNASFYLPSYIYNHDAMITRGEIPHVNYHQYLGHTYLASGQTAVLYAPLYLGLAVTRLFSDDLRPVIDVLAILHLLASALGMFVLLRRFTIDRRLSVALSLLWMTFPFLVVVSRSWIFVSYTAAFLPWGLVALERLIERPSALRALVVAAIKALFFYQGYVQYVILATLFEGIYLVLRGLIVKTSIPWRKQALTYSLALGASLALTAPLLLPMLQAKQVSAYRTSSLSFSEFLSNSLPLKAFLSAQLLHIQPRAIHLSTSAIFAIGLPTLLALLALLVTRRKRLSVVHLTMALLTLVLSTEAFAIMYYVPVLSSFRWPFKSFLFVLFFLTIAVAFAYQGWLNTRWTLLRWLAPTFLGVGLMLNLSIVWSDSLDAPFGPNRIRDDISLLHQQALERFPLEQGRVISLWMSPLEPEIHRLLIFNYATLVGAFHLGGYDPLIARENLDLALNLEYSNIFRYELTPERLNYLSSWSVRFFMLPESRMFPEIERLHATLKNFPQLRLIHRAQGIQVWENAAALPFSFFIEPEMTPVEAKWGPSSIRLATAGRGGWLRVNIASLNGYEWFADEREMGFVATDDTRHVMMNVPEGTREVEVRYVNTAFQLGVSIFLAFLLAISGAWLLRRVRRTSTTLGTS